MMAGHTLVETLSGLAWTMLSVWKCFGSSFSNPFGVVFALPLRRRKLSELLKDYKSSS